MEVQSEFFPWYLIPHHGSQFRYVKLHQLSMTTCQFQHMYENDFWNQQKCFIVANDAYASGFHQNVELNLAKQGITLLKKDNQNMYHRIYSSWISDYTSANFNRRRLYPTSHNLRRLKCTTNQSSNKGIALKQHKTRKEDDGKPYQRYYVSRTITKHFIEHNSIKIPKKKISFSNRASVAMTRQL